MNRKQLVLIAAIVMSFASSACYKIKSAGFILRGNTASLPGISEGGKLRWVSLEAQNFVVHIDPVSPCVGGANDLASSSSQHRGKTLTEAGCTIEKHMDGYYTYSFVSDKSAEKKTVAAGHGNSSGSGLMEIAFHVDYCPLCPPPPTGAVKFKKLLPKPTVAGSRSGGPNILVGCDHGAIYTIPENPSAHAGQVVVWSALGPEKSTGWQATFPQPFCKGGDLSFGTIVAGSPLGCAIPDDAKPGPVKGWTFYTPYSTTYSNSYVYSLEYQGAQTCKAEVNINVIATGQ